MNKLNITNFKKALNEIIDTNDWINLSRNGHLVGSITLSTDDYHYTSKKALIDAITIETRNDYDYEKDDGSSSKTLVIWIEFSNNGYCFYEFDDYSIGGF